MRRVVPAFLFFAACTPDIASTIATGGAGGGAHATTGATTGATTSNTSTNTGVGSSTGTTSAMASSSSGGGPTSVSASSGGPVFGPCDGVTDTFPNNDPLWAMIGGVDITGGAAHFQGPSTLTLTPMLGTTDCFISFRLVSGQFAGDARLRLAVHGDVTAYVESDGNSCTAGLDTGTSFMTGMNDPTGLGIAFYAGDVWFLAKGPAGWVSIGTTNKTIGTSLVQIVATGPGAAQFTVDDFGDPIPFSALN